MTIKEQQSKLFNDWGFPVVTDANGRKIRPGFRSDGVIDEPNWNQQEAKILFILKETNGGEGSLAYDLGHLKESIESGIRKGSLDGKVDTWSNISCWLRALQDIVYYQGDKADFARSLRWKDYEPQGKARNVARNLKGTVILNLKKSAGSARSRDGQIEKYFAKNEQWFKRQYNLYQPDIVVCCGPIVEKCIRGYGIIDTYDKASAHTCNTAVGKIWYYAPADGPVIIGFFHPQCTKNHEKMFKALTQTAAEALAVKHLHHHPNL